jgi:hypothetical protein
MALTRIGVGPGANIESHNDVTMEVMVAEMIPVSEILCPENLDS